MTNDKLYQLCIDYYANENDLAETLNSLSILVDGDQKISKTLMNVLGFDIDCNIGLEEIQTGSIKLKVKNFLNKVSDEDIKSKGFKAIFNQLLIDSKKYLLDYLDDSNHITKDDLKKIRKGLVEIAEKTNDPEITIKLEAITNEEILDCLDGITEPTKKLDNEQNIYAVYDGKKYPYNKESNYNRAEIEKSFEKEEFVNETEIVLVIKGIMEKV